MNPDSYGSGILHCGRAPAFWHNEVERMVECLVGAGRSSRWVLSWDAVLFDLCTEPLLGRTLGEVLGGLHAGGEDDQGSDKGAHVRITAAGTMRSGPSGSRTEDIVPSDRYAQDIYSQDRYAQADISSRISGRRQGHHASTMRRRRDAKIQRENIDLPSDFPRHADAQLLMRLAGDLHETHILLRKTAVASRYPWNNHAAQSRALLDRRDLRDWVDTLGARASKFLRAGSMEIVPGKSSDSLTFGGDTHLAENLGMPLDGLRAPPDLLEFLSGAVNGSDYGIARRGRRRRPHPGMPIEAHPTETASEMIEGRGAGARISSPVALSLPPMLPPRPVDATPAPLASDLSLLEAMRESSEAGEDLGSLSAKIKRILNEEARRYGIDV